MSPARSVEYLVEEGIDVTVDVLSHYIESTSEHFLEIDFGCDIKYRGGFNFRSGYSKNNLAFTRAHHNAAFRTLGSGYLHGFGVFEFPRRGRMAQFAFLKGYFAEGKSVCVYPDGGFYMGCVNSAAQPSGFGTYIYPNGRIYEGEWYLGCPTDRQELEKFGR